MIEKYLPLGIAISSGVAVTGGLAGFVPLEGLAGSLPLGGLAGSLPLGLVGSLPLVTGNLEGELLKSRTSTGCRELDGGQFLSGTLSPEQSISAIVTELFLFGKCFTPSLCTCK